MKFAVIIVNDSCSKNNDKNIALADLLEQEIRVRFPKCEISMSIVTGNKGTIKTEIIKKIVERYNVIFTIGRTGFYSRDFIPEITKEIIDKEAPAFAHAIISAILKIMPTAMMSRLVCGISKESLIVNLPAHEKLVPECFSVIKDQLEAACYLIKSKSDVVMDTEEHGREDMNNFNISNDSEKCREKFVLDENIRNSTSKVKIPSTLRHENPVPSPMVSVEEANNLIRVNTTPIMKTELIPINKSRGRVSAEYVLSTINVPSVDTSAEDGYAVLINFNNIMIKNRFVKNLANSSNNSVEEFEAVRVTKGAPIPEGANAVVMFKNTTVLKTTPDGQEELEIEMTTVPAVGDCVRKPGHHFPCNFEVLLKEAVITPFHICQLVAIGKTHVKVYKLPSIGIISTGSELQLTGNQLKPGQIYDTNQALLRHLLEENGFESNDCGIVGSNPDHIKAALEAAFEQNDVVITAGSLTKYDGFYLMKEIISKDFEESSIHFARVTVPKLRRIYKPVIFATVLYKDRPKTFFDLGTVHFSLDNAPHLFMLNCLRQMAHIPQISVEWKTIGKNKKRVNKKNRTQGPWKVRRHDNGPL